MPDSSIYTLNINGLSPCQSYWAVLTVDDCSSQITSTPVLIGLFEPGSSGLVVSFSANNTVVGWSSDGNQDLQRQLQSVVVTVTSECLTDVIPAQHQVFTVTPDQGNSVALMGFGTTPLQFT